MASWHTTYLHWQTEESTIHDPEWMALETARGIMEDLLAGGRVPRMGKEGFLVKGLDT